MNRPSLVSVLGVAIATTGCASVGAGSPVIAAATLSGATSPATARAEIRQHGSTMALVLTVRGMTPGTYGAHIHAAGRCEAPGYTSAGPHWNPTGRQHGRDNPQGAHHGDLPNLVIGPDGTGRLEATVPGTVDQLFDADGASVIIHAAADDLRSDPTGNSGARLLCGVLQRG